MIGYVLGYQPDDRPYTFRLDGSRQQFRYSLASRPKIAFSVYLDTFDPERDKFTFEVTLGGETFWSSVDFLVSVNGRTGMVIKCAAGSLDSRERQSIAAARVITSPPLPVAVVADPVTAVVLDVAAGKPTGESFGAIPTKDQLTGIMAEKAMEPLDPKRLEKEKRILLAFDAIKCCVPQGKDGGVHISEPEKD